MALAFPPPSAATAAGVLPMTGLEGISLPPGLEAPAFSAPPGLEKPRPRPSALDSGEDSAAVLSYGPRGSPKKRPSLPPAALVSSPPEDLAVTVLSYGPRGSPKKRVSLPPGALQAPQKPVLAYGPPKGMTSPRKRGTVLGYGPRGTPKSYFPRSPKKQPVLAYGPNGSPKKRGPLAAGVRMPRSPKKKAVPVYAPLQSSCLPLDTSVSTLAPAYVMPSAELSGDEAAVEASQCMNSSDWDLPAEHLPAVIQPKVVTTAIFGQFEDPTVAPPPFCNDRVFLSTSPSAMPR
eukprot:TRINITY_DN88689_c0_g1_i1.p1 TRINITY_DN88689_c0_g1~~TRINITY_DN88689_c0_g1_i1.p1  ORF type:complete len:290 (-),score=38.70 TRINITY_DN88689_c0_g1_i1:405-1274(-)